MTSRGDRRSHDDDVRASEVPRGRPLREVAAALPDDLAPVLLDGVGGPAELSRWRLLAFAPAEIVELWPDEAAGPGDPEGFAQLERTLARRWPHARAIPAGRDLPPFAGGAIGTFGYDLRHRLERLPRRAAPDADLPDLWAGVYPFVVAERVDGGPRLLVGRGDAAEERRMRGELERAERHARPPSGSARAAGPPVSTFTRARFLEAVERVRAHVLDGDVYQVNLAQRFEVPFTGDVCALHDALARRFPAPFGALLRTSDWSLVSSSPELFVRRRGERVESRPIKGTRPRGRDALDDAAQRAELEASVKERAELAMIVDLVRNDLGRTAELGSVRVEDAGATEAWSTLFHRVAVVSSRLAPGTSTAAPLAGAFPPASVTGTPKIRAMEIIDALEPVRRHAYTGAIGWIDAGGDVDLSVAIRVATLIDGRLLVPVGGGLTLRSEPGPEFDETLQKGRALFEVLGVEAPETRGAHVG